MGGFFLIIISSLLLLLGAQTTISPDVSLYHCYAGNFLQGEHFFIHDQYLYQSCKMFVHTFAHHSFSSFPTEYPVLSLLIFIFPLLFPFLGYESAFSLLIYIFFIAHFFLIKKMWSKKIAYLYIILLTITGFGTVLARYDVIPSFLILVSIFYTQKKKFLSAFIYLLFAIGVKLYAIVLVIPFIIYYLQKNAVVIPYIRKHLFAFCTCILVGLLGFFPLVLSAILRYIHRPIQVETVQASIIWLYTQLFHVPFYFSPGFGSVNVALPQTHMLLATGMSWLFLLISIIGAVWIIFLQITKKTPLLYTYTAFLYLVILTGRIFSPQYLIWLLPFVAYMYSKKYIYLGIWIVIGGLTTYIFPFQYTNSLLLDSPLPFTYITILVKNILLVILGGTFIYQLQRIKKSNQ